MKYLHFHVDTTVFSHIMCFKFPIASLSLISIVFIQLTEFSATYRPNFHHILHVVIEQNSLTFKAYSAVEKYD